MTRRSRKLIAGTVANVGTALLAACSAGTPVSPRPLPDKIDVRVSAGSPVAGAVVTVYAISDVTGLVDAAAGAGGVLGSGGPTDSSGKATIALSSHGYSGPVQVVANGPSMSYADPTIAPDPNASPTVIQFPAAFSLTSYVTRFASPAVVPVTMLTTLADHEALAWARGRHADQRTTTTITQALAARDPLFVTHFTKTSTAWDPATLRVTTPAMLTDGSQSLVDVAYAALFDVALNELAHATAIQAGYGTGSGGITAPMLLQLLEQDVDADGILDGKANGGNAIQTAGTSPVMIDTQFLRLPLAVALDAWVREAANKSGISDADLASARVFSTMTGDQSGLFGSAPVLSFDPLDRTPPVLAFVVAPPVYSSSARVTLTLDATDSSGVQAVYALVGATRYQGVLVNGSWSVGVSLPAVGHNSVVVWADDHAQPATNSGAGLGPPYELATDIVYDPDAPAALYDSSFASYADESSLGVQAGNDGLATVPAVYVQQPKTAVPNGGDIYKAATRLAVGGPADVTELEGINVANIPVLRFSVPFNPNTDAPITRADFEVAVTCNGCGTFPAAAGSLLASPSAVPGALYFDLPLSTETVPALAQVSGPASLAVSLHLADGAGNAATVGGFNFTFHVLGPPLAIVEDTAYAGYGDPRSTFPYRVAGLAAGVDTYSTLFDPSSAAFFDGKVRLVRYVVSNPSPGAVAISATYLQDAGGSWQMTEVWPRRSFSEQPWSARLNDPGSATPYVIDGFWFSQALYWAMPFGTSGANLAKTETASNPCGAQWGWPAHRIGDTVTKWVCPGVNVVNPGSNGVFASSIVTPAIYAGFQQGGGEVLSPRTDTTGTTFIVPGAVGTSPGTLVLYLTRPVSAPRNRALQMNVIGTVNAYETYDYEVFWPYYTWTYSMRYVSYQYEVYLMFKSGQYLQSATENIAGTLTVATRGLSGSTLVGEPAARFSETYSRTVATH